jgi:F-type H+-transporting ATPase subunit delta
VAKKLGKLAIRYAKALSKTVAEDRSLNPDQLASLVEQFSAAWQKEQSLQHIVLSPMFEVEKRAGVLLDVAKAAGLPEILQRFLRVLIERDRMAYFPEIATAFRSVVDQAAGVVKVQVTTARAVAADEQAVIEKNIARQLQASGASGVQSAVFSWSEDPALIGGMVVRYGGIVLDGSLAGRLEKIERGLLA